MTILLKILLWPLSFIYSSLPRSIQIFLANIMGIIWFDVVRLRRQTVLKNLDIAFPDWDKSKKIRIGRKSVQNLCLTFLEYLIMLQFKPEWVKKYVITENFDIVRDQLKNGKGALVLGLHLGSIDLAMTGFIGCGFEIFVTTKKIKTKALNDIFLELRKKTETGCLEDRKNPFDIFRLLKNNKVIGIVMDQYMGKPHGIEAKFFGYPAGTAAGLAAFSIKTGLPVIPLYNFRRGDGKILLRAATPIPVELSGDREKDLLLMTQKYNDKIEELVRSYPDQWMWVHKRWKKYV